MEHKSRYKVEDFLKDDSFIRYVLDASPEDAPYWQHLLRKHPELNEEAAAARRVLTGSRPEHTLSGKECDELKKRIFESIDINT